MNPRFLILVPAIDPRNSHFWEARFQLPQGLAQLGAEFPGAEDHLSTGDKIVLYSDGVTEARNTEGEFFGRKRLREVVAGHASEPCQAIHEAIQAAVAAFTEGAPQADDITALVLEFGG